MSNPIRVLIVDDEAPARAVVRKHLEAYADILVAGECSNGFEALKVIPEIKPDLIFLDIQMPKITGFEMLELLDEKPVIIFCTAYDQYALKAFDTSAADYLLKPFSQGRFTEALKRARLFLGDRAKHTETVQKLVQNHDENDEIIQRVVVKIGSQIRIIPVEQIVWLEAQDDYVMLNTQGDAFLKQKTMKYFEKHLSTDEFVRLHRSHIVRISFIKQLELSGKETYRALLKNGKKLPVSRSGHAKLKQLFE